MGFTKVAPAGIGTQPGDGITIGDSFLHTTGIDIGHNTGIGVTIRKHGDATFTGIITASAFFGDGSGLEGVTSSGIGTPLSDVDTDVLNKVYYVNKILSIGSTVTIDHPESGATSYTHYTDVMVEGDADLIVADGDTFVPDVLGISSAGINTTSAVGGRIRAGQITNAAGDGAPNFPNGITVTGVVTATTLNQSASGDLSIPDKIVHIGDTNTTIRFPAADTITAETSGSERVRITNNGYVGINTDNPVNALEVLGKSSNTDTIAGVTVHEIARFNADTSEKFGLKLSLDNTNKVFYLHRSDNGGDLAFSTRSGGANYERLRIGSAGQLGIAGANYGTAGQVLVSQGPSSAPTWSGGTTRTLEYISAPCSNESIATYWGSRSTQQVSGVQNLTSTYADLTGSSITYRPPVGAHTVIYRFSYQFSQSDADPIAHFRFYVGSDEIIYARHTKRGDDHQDRTTFEWPIRIDGSQADNLNHGRFQSWNGDKVLKMQAREYDGSYEVKLHVTQNWDGGGTDMFSMPVISIIALGS